MKQIHKNQNDFCETMDLCGPDAWNDKFTWLVALSEQIPVKCPVELLPHRVLACQSMTYFHAFIFYGKLRVNGWCNTAVQRGIIASMIHIFDGTPAFELTDESDVFFHIKSGLIDHLTPLRQGGLREMIRRITVLCPEKTQA